MLTFGMFRRLGAFAGAHTRAHGFGLDAFRLQPGIDSAPDLFGLQHAVSFLHKLQPVCLIIINPE
jgi:hypothetical protein